MGQIFSKQEEAHNYYIQANKNYKTAKTWGIISLSGLGLSGILVAVGISQGENGLGPLVLSVLTFFSFPLAGTIGLITRRKGKRNEKFSIALFNASYGVQLPEDNPVELSLVLKNGIGLQLRF